MPLVNTKQELAKIQKLTNEIKDALEYKSLPSTCECSSCSRGMRGIDKEPCCFCHPTKEGGSKYERGYGA